MTTESANGTTNGATNGTSYSGEPIVQALLKALNNGGGQTIIEALRNGADGTTLVKSFLAQAHLSAEQQSLVDMLLATQENKNSDERLRRDGDDVVDIEPTSNRAFDRSDRRELRDLRQVNDTLAAALGACRVCWGGDSDCDVCGGRGRAGFASPDLELFDELVAPALRRVLTMRRAGRIGLTRSRR